MITEGYLRRHTAAYGGNREIALLDVAQDYILEHLRREDLCEDILVFKGGTALRKFVFGAEGRFSVDLDFALRQDDPSHADLVLDLLDGATFGRYEPGPKGNTVQLSAYQPATEVAWHEDGD